MIASLNLIINIKDLLNNFFTIKIFYKINNLLFLVHKKLHNCEHLVFLQAKS